MSNQTIIEDFVSRCDLSCLVALRVLLTQANEEGRMGRAELLEGMQREYLHLREATRSLPATGAEGGTISPLLADSTLEYLEEHTVGRLAAEGIVTREISVAPLADGAETPAKWTEVRLAEPVLELRHVRNGDILDRLEERLDRTMLGVRAERPVTASPMIVEPVNPAPVRIPAPPAPAPRVERSTLAARGLVKTYRQRRVVNEVDVHVSEGEIVGLLGPNGAGKTTTFYMMVGLIAPDKGKVYLGKQDLTSVPMFKRARRGIGYLAQEPSIFRRLTVEQNILAILQMRGFSRREQRERLERLLNELGIKHLRSTKAYALSGGERRRLEITRALVGEPKFMLLDEPFAGVDPIAVHDIQQIVADLRRRDIGVLISDHNVEQTLDIVDRAYIMYDGRVRVSGTVSELVWNDEVAEIYLGPTLTARMRQRYTHPE